MPSAGAAAIEPAVCASWAGAGPRLERSARGAVATLSALRVSADLGALAPAGVASESQTSTATLAARGASRPAGAAETAAPGPQRERLQALPFPLHLRDAKPLVPP